MDADATSAPPAPRGRRSRARLAAIGIAVAATLLSSACAAGQQAQTADEKASIDGVNKSVGSIDLRAVALKAPVGSTYYISGADVEFTAVIVNGGQTTDTLTSVSSPSATGGWGSYSEEDGYLVQTSDSDAATAAAGTPTESSSASASASPSPSDSLPAGASSVSITAGNRVSWGTPDSSKVLLLRKLRDRLYPGNSIAVTFTFAKAGSVTLQVPVQLSASPGSAEVPNPSGSESIPN